MRRAVVVVLLASIMLGVVTPKPAAAWAIPPAPTMLPPTVTAPSGVAGLCTGPWGVILCWGGVLIGGASEASKWWDSISGGPAEVYGHAWDAELEAWVLCVPHEGECSGGGGGGGAWGPDGPPQAEGAPAYVGGHEVPWGWDTPPVGSDSFLPVNTPVTKAPEPVYLVPTAAGETAAAELGIEVLGGVVQVVDGGRVVRATVWVAAPESCGQLQRDHEWHRVVHITQRTVPWSNDCQAVSVMGWRNAGLTGEFGMFRNDTDIECSGGGPLEFSGAIGGSYTYIEAACPAGQTVTQIVDYPGATNPNPPANIHFRMVGRGNGLQRDIPMTLIPDPVPLVTPSITTTCRDAEGNVTVRKTFGEPVPAFATEITLPAAGCLPGEIPVEWEGELCPEVGECESIGGGELPIETYTENELSCVQRLATPEPCPMWLEVWDGSEWDYCDPAAGNCEGWWTDPARDSKYRCGWGGDYYSAAQCIALKDFYDVEEGGPVTETPPPGPNTDPQPNPVDINSDPVRVVGPENPVTQRPNVPWWKRVIYEWSTGSTVDMQGACWPQGWGLLNPLQWVLRPIMCALTWAFVPTTSVEARLENVRDAWEARTGLVPEIIPEVAGPVVGGTCGWGFDSVDTPALGVIPEVDVIWCPSEHGVTTQAAVMRGLGLGALGLMVVSMVMRWVSMGSSHETGPNEGFQGSMS